MAVRNRDGPYAAAPTLNGGVGAARREYMTAFVVHFGIKPWEIDRLTVTEFLALCQYVDQLNSR